MDFIVHLVRAVVMLGFVALIIAALACLFMIVFAIAAGLDRRIQE